MTSWSTGMPDAMLTQMRGWIDSLLSRQSDGSTPERERRVRRRDRCRGTRPQQRGFTLKVKPRTALWMITWWVLALVCLYFTTVVTGIGRLALFAAGAILVSAGSWPTQRRGFG